MSALAPTTGSVAAALIRAHDQVQRRLGELNKLAAATIDDREMMKVIDEARTAEMRGLNEAFEALEAATRPPAPGQKLKKAVREAVGVP